MMNRTSSKPDRSLLRSVSRSCTAPVQKTRPRVWHQSVWLHEHKQTHRTCRSCPWSERTDRRWYITSLGNHRLFQCIRHRCISFDDIRRIPDIGAFTSITVSTMFSCNRHLLFTRPYVRVTVTRRNKFELSYARVSSYGTRKRLRWTRLTCKADYSESGMATYGLFLSVLHGWKHGQLTRNGFD